MSARSLFDPVIDGGIRNPNWFEGRLLTADAMRAKDKAERLRQRLLGRAIGAGIFEGLFVTRGLPDSDGVHKTLNITKGAAINGEGDVLMLSQDVTVDVVPPTTPAQPEPKLFDPCQPSPTASVPAGFGIYVLLMAPASAYRERAEKSGLGTEGIVTGCGDAFAVDGVRFRTEKLEPVNISGIDNAARAELTRLIADSANATSRSMLRNLIAHYCFGTPELARFPVDPFARSGGGSDWVSYGAIDDLRGLKRITSCDLPLALLLWNQSGVAFLDLWAVRRRSVPPSRSKSWPLLVDARSEAEGEARFLQFQAHLTELVDELVLPSSLQASLWFRYLPAAGILPIAEPGLGTEGVAVTTFFQGLVVHYPRPPQFDARDGPVVLEGARLTALVRDSFVYSPSDLTTRQAIWLYRLRENRYAIDTQASGAPLAAVLFATGQMPYVATPRFDIARWDYSNYLSALLGPGAL